MRRDDVDARDFDSRYLPMTERVRALNPGAHRVEAPEDTPPFDPATEDRDPRFEELDWLIAEQERAQRAKSHTGETPAEAAARVRAERKDASRRRVRPAAPPAGGAR